jgi:hypothetical protein
LRYGRHLRAILFGEGSAIMLRQILRALPCAAVLIVWIVSTTPCRGQAFGGGESERALRTMGVYVPYDGMSLTERYNFSTGSFFYLNQDPRTLWWADYFDRVDRAEKFGYPCPQEPWFPNGRPYGARCGFGRYRCR